MSSGSCALVEGWLVSRFRRACFVVSLVQKGIFLDWLDYKTNESLKTFFVEKEVVFFYLKCLNEMDGLFFSRKEMSFFFLSVNFI